MGWLMRMGADNVAVQALRRQEVRKTGRDGQIRPIANRQGGARLSGNLQEMRIS